MSENIFSEPTASDCDPILRGDAANVSGEALVARLGLMTQLEASLRCSRASLLALDLEGIRLGTSEQIQLARSLAALSRPSRGNAPASEGESERAKNSGLLLACRASAQNILELVRVHAALLRRAQSKLRVLANMLAGPSATYGPFTARTFETPRKRMGQSNCA
ncbi:MAG: hypothetical protein WBX38_01600 [Candidatus Sulfotelmatobacter sp.]